MAEITKVYHETKPGVVMLSEQMFDSLIAENLRLEQERSDWKGKASKRGKTIDNLKWKMKGAYTHVDRVQNDNVAKSAVLEEFREENAQLREALEFYANKKNHDWYQDFADSVIESPVMKDEGETARDALGVNPNE